MSYGQGAFGAPGQGAFGGPGAIFPVDAGYQPYDRAAFGEPPVGMRAVPSGPGQNAMPRQGYMPAPGSMSGPGYMPGPGSMSGRESMPRSDSMSGPGSSPIPMPQDDNAAVAALINEMEKLDHSRQLQGGDYISFRIVEEGSANAFKRLRINESGTVNVPHVGLMVAAGKTCYQLAREVSAELERDFFNRATVIVVLHSSWEDRAKNHWGSTGQERGAAFMADAEFITLFGQVGRQGRMILPRRGSLTISSAILQAGGFARFANTRNVRVLRRINDTERRTIIVDVDSIMRRGYLNKDIELKKDDVIIVSEKLINL